MHAYNVLSNHFTYHVMIIYYSILYIGQTIQRVTNIIIIIADCSQMNKLKDSFKLVNGIETL